MQKRGCIEAHLKSGCRAACGVDDLPPTDPANPFLVVQLLRPPFKLSITSILLFQSQRLREGARAMQLTSRPSSDRHCSNASVVYCNICRAEIVARERGSRSKTRVSKTSEYIELEVKHPFTRVLHGDMLLGIIATIQDLGQSLGGDYVPTPKWDRCCCFLERSIIKNKQCLNTIIGSCADCSG